MPLFVQKIDRSSDFEDVFGTKKIEDLLNIGV